MLGLLLLLAACRVAPAPDTGVVITRSTTDPGDPVASGATELADLLGTWAGACLLPSGADSPTEHYDPMVLTVSDVRSAGSRVEYTVHDRAADITYATSMPISVALSGSTVGVSPYITQDTAGFEPPFGLVLEVAGDRLTGTATVAEQAGTLECAFDRQ